MNKLLLFWILMNLSLVCTKQIPKKEKFSNQDIEVSDSNFSYKYIKPIGPYTDELNEEITKNKYAHSKGTFSHENPLLEALILSTNLHSRAKNLPPNHPDLPPINPFLALLLSQYGRYVPLYGPGKGIYAYQASNDFHNNKPFGAYKIYEDGE
ncbi:unnamed protein product [Psylliodes chrysocephalus]|uniref:Uncharacterized protein n=1 Tax=Psylliodes chrysocephalus TaxID=3402493 RepID=A0A9P0GE05_9CUCU|nr:unnamed protein product [Psylliodes chrysocephala]